MLSDHLGKYDEAIKAYDEAINLDPKLASAWNNKGNVSLSQGKYDEAIQAYDKAIKLDPKLAPAWNNKGNALYKQGKYDEAIQAYDKAIEMDPNDARCLDQQRHCSQRQGKYDEAIEAFDKAISLILNMQMPGTTKAMLSLTRASTMRLSRLMMRLSELNPTDAACLVQQRRCSHSSRQVR